MMNRLYSRDLEIPLERPSRVGFTSRLDSLRDNERASRLGSSRDNERASRLGSLRDIGLEPRLGSVRDNAPAPRLGSLRDNAPAPRLGSLRDIDLEPRFGSLRDKEHASRLGSLRDINLEPRLGSLRDNERASRLGSVRDIDLEPRLGSVRDNASAPRVGSLRDLDREPRFSSARDSTHALRDNAQASRFDSIGKRDKMPTSDIYTRRDEIPLSQSSREVDAPLGLLGSRRDNAPVSLHSSERGEASAKLSSRKAEPPPIAFRRDKTHVSLLGAETDKLSTFHSRSVLNEDLYSRDGRNISKRDIDHERRGSEADYYRGTVDEYERLGSSDTKSRPRVTEKLPENELYNRSRFSRADRDSSNVLSEQIIQSKRKSQDDSISQGFPLQKHHKWADSEETNRAIKEQLRSENERVKLEIRQLDEMKRQKEQELLRELHMMESFKERKHEELQRQVMEQEMIKRDMLMRQMAGANAAHPNMNKKPFHMMQQMAGANAADPNMNQEHFHINEQCEIHGRGRPFMHRGRGRMPPHFGPDSKKMGFNASTMQRGNQSQGRPFVHRGRGQMPPPFGPGSKQMGSNASTIQLGNQSGVAGRGSHANKHHLRRMARAANFKSKNQNVKKGKKNLPDRVKKNLESKKQKQKKQKEILEKVETTKRKKLSKKLEKELGVNIRGKVGWRFAFEVPKKVWTCYACGIDTETEEKHAEHLETVEHEEALAQTAKKARLKLLQLQRNFMNEHKKDAVLGNVLLAADSYDEKTMSPKEVWIFKNYECKVCGVYCYTSTGYIKHNLSVAHIKKVRTFIATDVKLKSGTLEYPGEYNPEVCCGDDLVWVKHTKICTVCGVSLGNRYENMGHFNAYGHFYSYKALLQKEDENKDEENAKNVEEQGSAE